MYFFALLESSYCEKRQFSKGDVLRHDVIRIISSAGIISQTTLLTQIGRNVGSRPSSSADLLNGLRQIRLNRQQKLVARSTLVHPNYKHEKKIYEIANFTIYDFAKITTEETYHHELNRNKAIRLKSLAISNIMMSLLQ